MDPDPREIHDHEQGEAAVREIAFFVWTYYRELVQLGMPEESACKLALGYQAGLLGGAFGRDAGGRESE